MKKLKIALPLLILYFLAAISLYFFHPGGEAFYSNTTFVMTMLLLVVIIVLSAELSYVYGLRSDIGKSMLFLCLSFIVDMLAEASWWVLGEPVVSISDVLFLLYYPLFVICIYFGMRVAHKEILHDKKKMSIVYLFIAAVIVIYLFLIRSAWKAEEDLLVNFLTTGYVFMDMIVIITVVFLCFSILYGSLSKAWLFVLGYAFLIALSDFEYSLAYENISGLYYIVNIIADMLLIYGLISFKRSNEEAKNLIMNKKV